MVLSTRNWNGTMNPRGLKGLGASNWRILGPGIQLQNNWLSKTSYWRDKQCVPLVEFNPGQTERRLRIRPECCVFMCLLVRTLVSVSADPRGQL